MSTTLRRLGAIAGIAFPILQLAAQGLIQAGGAEPSFRAPGPEILAFFQSRDRALFEIGAYLSAVSMIAFLWFVAALWSELRQAEGGEPWLSTIVLGSGLVAANGLMESGGWPLAVFRINDGLDPQLARTLFDAGNFNFANLWVALGSLVLAAGLSFRSSGTFPAWLAWGSLLLALALVLARAVWTSPIAFVPYLLFWVWMITLGTSLRRRWLAAHRMGGPSARYRHDRAGHPARLAGPPMGRAEELIGRAGRAVPATALAGLVVALGPGHNIPLLGGTPGSLKGALLLLAIALVSCVVLVEVRRYLGHRYPKEHEP